MSEQDNISNKIEALFGKHGEQVEVGKKLGVLSKGWLSISEREDSWHVMYTNGKDEHYRLFSDPALGADFLKDSGERKIGPLYLKGAWKSALSMRPVIDEGQAVEVFDTVKGYIEQAHTHSFG